MITGSIGSFHTLKTSVPHRSVFQVAPTPPHAANRGKRTLQKRRGRRKQREPSLFRFHVRPIAFFHLPSRLQYVSTCLSRIYNLDIRILHIHNVHTKRHVTRSRQRRVDCVEHFKTLFKPEVSPKLMWKNAAKVLGLETSEGG